MTGAAVLEAGVLKGIPSQITDGEILNILYTSTINWKHIDAIKKITDLNDDIISDWLSVSVKTLRSYRKPKSTFGEKIQEHVLLLLALFKHGITVFGTANNFENWLDSENFFFDNKKPETFLNTVTGIKFVDDRLTSIEFGDNV
jgi:uncharacterized protein (DUF2384 family)